MTQQTLFADWDGRGIQTPRSAKRQSPDERYGPFPDGAHYVVWRTLCVWALREWMLARGRAA